MNPSRRKPQNPEVRRILGLPHENAGDTVSSKRQHGCCVDKAYGTPKGCTPETCMELPHGKTCLDCRHKVRCVSMFGAELTNTFCGFFPRRFQQTALEVMA